MKTLPLLIALSLLPMLVKGQLKFTSKRQFSNTGYSEEHVPIRLGYGKKDNCDTLFVGKKQCYVLVVSNWHGWEKGHKFKKNESQDEGYSLSNNINPKNGRTYVRPTSDWWWLVFLDEWAGKKLNRVTLVNFKTGEYKAWLK